MSENLEKTVIDSSSKLEKFFDYEDNVEESDESYALYEAKRKGLAKLVLSNIDTAMEIGGKRFTLMYREIQPNDYYGYQTVVAVLAVDGKYFKFEDTWQSWIDDHNVDIRRAKEVILVKKLINTFE